MRFPAFFGVLTNAEVGDEKLDKNVEEVFNANPSHTMIIDDIR